MTTILNNVNSIEGKTDSNDKPNSKRGRLNQFRKSCTEHVPKWWDKICFPTGEKIVDASLKTQFKNEGIKSRKTGFSEA